RGDDGGHGGEPSAEQPLGNDVVQHEVGPPSGLSFLTGDAMSSRNCFRSSARHRDMPFTYGESVPLSGREGGSASISRGEGKREPGERFMCAPIGGRSGPVGAHPRTRGTARTLAGSVRSDRINYTGLAERAY